LIIGLKFKLTGAAPALCASLLFARHGASVEGQPSLLIFILIVTLTLTPLALGIVSIGTAAFLKLFLPVLTAPEATAAAIAARSSARLAAVLQCQAAASIIAVRSALHHPTQPDTPANV
jgi:hypothetical protein